MTWLLKKMGSTINSHLIWKTTEFYKNWIKLEPNIHWLTAPHALPVIEPGYSPDLCQWRAVRSLWGRTQEHYWKFIWTPFLLGIPEAKRQLEMLGWTRDQSHNKNSEHETEDNNKKSGKICTAYDQRVKKRRIKIWRFSAEASTSDKWEFHRERKMGVGGVCGRRLTKDII